MPSTSDCSCLRPCLLTSFLYQRTSPYCPVGYWTTRGYANSRTGQLANVTGDFACLVFVLLVASARPQVVQSANCPVRQLAIRELAYPRVVQLPIKLATRIGRTLIYVHRIVSYRTVYCNMATGHSITRQTTLNTESVEKRAVVTKLTDTQISRCAFEASGAPPPPS